MLVDVHRNWLKTLNELCEPVSALTAALQPQQAKGAFRGGLCSVASNLAEPKRDPPMSGPWPHCLLAFQKCRSSVHTGTMLSDMWKQQTGADAASIPPHSHSYRSYYPTALWYMQSGRTFESFFPVYFSFISQPAGQEQPAGLLHTFLQRA